MPGFVKLRPELLTSTVWMEDDQTVRVWITLLLLADPTGLVLAPIPGIATQARVTLDATRRAIEKFQEPDPDSRTLANEGRRIVKVEVDGMRGLQILNFERNRERDDTNAERQRRYRDAHRNTVTALRNGGDGVTIVTVTQAEAEIRRQKAEADLSAGSSSSQILPTHTFARARARGEDVDVARQRQRPTTADVGLADSDAQAPHRRGVCAEKAIPEQENAARADSTPPPEPSGYDLAKRVWLANWSESYGEPYRLSPNLGPKSEHATLRMLGEIASEWAAGKSVGPTKWLEWMTRMYIRDNDERLVAARHPLKWLESRMNSYGDPSPAWLKKEAKNASTGS